MSSNLSKIKITGKWNRNTYVIEKSLGKGANGQVFLARQNDRPCALKLGENETDLMHEIKTLKYIQQAQAGKLGPFLHDVDDTEWNGRTMSFYVMDWIEGITLKTFINRQRWMTVGQVKEVILPLLDDLEMIHQTGHGFGDLKPENIILEKESGRPILVDYGGVTPFGRSVRQFTEDYDRSSWKAGLRVSEPSYDLFAIGLLMVEMVVGSPAWKKCASRRRLGSLYDIIRRHKQIQPLNPLFKKVFQSQYENVGDFRQDLIDSPDQRNHIQAERWIPVLFLLSSVLFVFSVYLYF
ncbi:MAG: hypothetical protein H0Z33_12500 [Bacillaceae bacterium]|nr:hypothetical protein [Bacillaceae bacterium]